MALAGLYDYWRDPAVPGNDDPAARLTTCAVITTDATDAAGRVHPRMSLALPRPLRRLARPAPPGPRRPSRAEPTGGRPARRTARLPAVNDVRDNGPHLVEERVS